jgi:hypothetical protein
VSRTTLVLSAAFLISTGASEVIQPLNTRHSPQVMTIKMVVAVAVAVAVAVVVVLVVVVVVVGLVVVTRLSDRE